MFNPELWALQAAYKDSSLLISPNARERSLDILRSAPAYETRPYLAAVSLLLDGGEQQGTHTGPYHGPDALRMWSDDMNLLKKYLNGIKYHLEDE